MATTTNYSWTTPDDTGLVKDGASAIRSLGTAIDTTTKNLNPSTTLGDIEYRSSTTNTNTRLAIGSTGNVLTVAGGVPTWAAPAGGGSGLTYVGGSTFSATSTVNINNVFSATYANYVVYYNVQMDGGGAVGGQVRLRVSGADDSSASYDNQGVSFAGSSALPGQSLNQTQGSFGDLSTQQTSGQLNFYTPYATAKTNFSALGIMYGSAIETFYRCTSFDGTTSFTGFTFLNSGAGAMTGNIRVYGLANS